MSFSNAMQAAELLGLAYEHPLITAYLIGLLAELLMLPLLELIQMGKVKMFHPKKFFSGSWPVILVRWLLIPLGLLSFPCLLAMGIGLRIFIPFGSARRAALRAIYWHK